MAPRPLGPVWCGLDTQTLRRWWVLERLSLQFRECVQLLRTVMAVGLLLHGFPRTIRVIMFLLKLKRHV